MAAEKEIWIAHPGIVIKSVKSLDGQCSSYVEVRSISAVPVVAWTAFPFLKHGEKRAVALSAHLEPSLPKDYPGFWFAYPGSPLLKNDECRGGAPSSPQLDVDAIFKTHGGPTRLGFLPPYAFSYVGPRSTPGGYSITIEWPGYRSQEGRKGCASVSSAPFLIMLDGRAQTGVLAHAAELRSLRHTGLVKPLGKHHNPPELWPPAEGEALRLAVHLPHRGSAVRYYFDADVTDQALGVDELWGMLPHITKNIAEDAYPQPVENKNNEKDDDDSSEAVPDSGSDMDC